MAVPVTSLAISKFLVNSLNLLEELQNADVSAMLTQVPAKGIADRYGNPQVTKRKVSINFMAHWYNATSGLQATNLDISLWTLGGTAYLGQVKSGSLEVSNTGPEVSGIAQLDEYPLATNTELTINTDLMVVTEAYFTNQAITGTVATFPVTVAITFAGEVFTVSGILESSKHTVARDQVQMENPVIRSNAAPVTTGDTASLLYLSAIGSAITGFDLDTSVNEYKNQASGNGSTALISKFGLKFADKALIEQSVTVEVQGGPMLLTAGG